MALSKQQMITLLLTMAWMMIMLPAKTEALIPYNNRPLWDMMIPSEDPFKIFEQNPFNLAKNLETINLARADWKETSMHHVISLDVPGMKREDIKIEVEENRVLKLPANSDLENITAHLEDGVLKIKVPKMAQEKKQSKVIDIMEHGTSGCRPS
ncbi:HSP20-like chaperones superfamily protein [Artemisia annua]|uniref:HSP20-like chaperones superfamily protein n=1 Tax=Artemisia annua TaxID=35608 RepID=A0A2U1LK67_ARTAN|nr:HSP20-like chaperones superfamily protein [Artemisia annua]